MADFISILAVRIVCMINVSVWSVMHVSKSPLSLDTLGDLDYSVPNKSSGLGAVGNWFSASNIFLQTQHTEEEK